MDNANMSQSHSANNHTWRVSWVAYTPHALIAAAILQQLFFGGDYTNSALVLSLFSIGLLYAGYQSYYLSTIRLFVNKEGVWVFRGVFPWSRGIYGVKWQDFEDCIFYMGFVRWATNSSPVTLRPRFSQNPPVTVPSIYKGKNAVETISAIAAQYRHPQPK